MIVSGYSMDLYCDAAGPYNWQQPPHRYDEFPHTFTGETYGECARDARKRGWTLTREGRAICPKCSGKHRAPRCTD